MVGRDSLGGRGLNVDSTCPGRGSCRECGVNNGRAPGGVLYICGLEIDGTSRSRSSSLGSSTACSMRASSASALTRNSFRSSRFASASSSVNLRSSSCSEIPSVIAATRRLSGCFKSAYNFRVLVSSLSSSSSIFCLRVSESFTIILFDDCDWDRAPPESWRGRFRGPSESGMDRGCR